VVIGSSVIEMKSRLKSRLISVNEPEAGLNCSCRFGIALLNAVFIK